MRGICSEILDKVVKNFGPVSITYGYVSPDLAPKIRASPLHRYAPSQGVGGAVDVVVHKYPDPVPVFEWVRDNCIYDRMILYPGSRIICLAWTKERPRYECKEWILSPKGNQYIDFKRDKRQLNLSDPLPFQ